MRRSGNRRLLRRWRGYILRERRQEIIGPADHIGVADDGIELFPSRLALGERHVHRGPDRAGDFAAVVRIDEQRIGQLFGRARETRENEYARIFGILRGDIFLRDGMNLVAKEYVAAR